MGNVAALVLVGDRIFCCCIVSFLVSFFVAIARGTTRFTGDHPNLCVLDAFPLSDFFLWYRRNSRSNSATVWLPSLERYHRVLEHVQRDRLDVFRSRFNAPLVQHAISSELAGARPGTLFYDGIFSAPAIRQDST